MRAIKIVLASLLALIVMPTAVMAEEAETEAPETPSQTQREERQRKARESYPVSLSERESASLKNRCQAAQKYLERIAEKFDDREPTITRKYELIDKHIAAIQRRLTSQGVDTSTIDLFLASFRELVDEYKVKLEDYRLSLDLVIEFDCEEDPQTFRSLLEDTRAKRRDFASTLGSVTSLIQNDLRTSFDAVREQLKPSEE